jgi:hypothetical protein
MRLDPGSVRLRPVRGDGGQTQVLTATRSRVHGALLVRGSGPSRA